MIRLYYRFKNVPVDRPGGPWWYRDFVRPDLARDYLRDVGPFLEEAFRLHRGNLAMPEHDPMMIEPAPDAEPVDLRRLSG